MGSLSNLYISQSYISLIHLGTNSTITTASVELQDGLGNGIGVFVNSLGDVNINGTFEADLQKGYVWVGDASGRTSLVATSSFNATTIAALNQFTASQLVINSGYNTYTSSANQRLSSLETNSASVNISVTNLNQFTASLDNTYVTDTEFRQYTSSTNSRLNNIETTTASLNTSVTNLNASSASQQVSINALNVFTASQSTASIVTSITNLNSFTSSQNSKNTTLEVVTSSLQSFTQSAQISINALNTNSASVNTSINALNTFTASQSTASIITSINNLNTFSASALVSISNINSTTASLNTSVTNINQFTQSANIRLNNLETTSASVNISIANINSTTASQGVSITNINSFTQSAQTQLNSLTSKTGSYATTGSNAFYGNQTITGSIIINGNQIITGSITISGSIITIDRSGNNTNTAIGLNALGLSSNVSGQAIGNTNSIAIGFNAMRYASGSQQNVAIGYNVMPITSGSNNFALGTQAMENNTTGNQNIAIGAGALNKNTTGKQNTIIGNDAGFFNTTGSNNTYLGASAGNNVSGSNNIILGGYQGIGTELNNNIIFADGQGNIKAQQNGTAWILTGSLDVSGSLTASLEQGYMWVGNGSNKTTLISTSSFNGGGGSTNTGSLMVTGSVNVNILTFTKGDGTTFNLEVAASGSVTPGTISGSAQISALGFVSSSVTASSLVTASFNNGTRNLTFTKGDASTFSVNIPDVSGSSGNFATTGSNQFNGNQSISGSVTLSGSLNNVDYIDFNTASATPAWKSGRVFWDNTDGCLAVYNVEQDITLQVGQENWTRVYNGTGLTIANGTAVRLSGTHGDVPEVVLAQAIAISGSANVTNQILGLATHTIETGTYGYITTQGLVRGLNTNAFTDGATLYVSTSAGLLTTTPPAAPYESIPIGQCVKASPGASGIIYVAVEQPIDFSDLSSVLVSGSYSDGDMWQYVGSGATGSWRHNTIAQIGLTTTSSFNSYTSSTNSRLNSLEAKTGSYATTGSNSFNGNQIITGSLFAGIIGQTNNLNGRTIITGSMVVSGSGNIFIGEQIITGSLFISGGIGLYGNQIITGSLIVTNGITGSIAANNNVISSSAQITALGFISSSQTINTGSFATTGSNTFIGDQIISGSLFVTSSISVPSINKLTSINTQLVGPTPPYPMEQSTGTIFFVSYGSIPNSNPNIYQANSSGAWTVSGSGVNNQVITNTYGDGAGMYFEAGTSTFTSGSTYTLTGPYLADINIDDVAFIKPNDPALQVGSGVQPYPGFRIVVDTEKNPGNVFGFVAIDNIASGSNYNDNAGFSLNTFGPAQPAFVIYGGGNGNNYNGGTESIYMYGGIVSVVKNTQITGSLAVSTAMNLKPNDPLPGGTIGDLAVSGSSLYFYNGAWTLVV